jgi:hypothetical protein
MNDWIGTVLAALGHHIRWLEDENLALRRELMRIQGEHDGVPFQIPGADQSPRGLASSHEPKSEGEDLA